MTAFTQWGGADEKIDKRYSKTQLQENGDEAPSFSD
jgi:hypothetical protein